VNVVALTLTFVAAVFGFGTPLTAVQLLWVNLIMDSFAALALALEPPSDRLFEQPPHGRAETLISRQMWLNILVTAGCMLAVLLFVLVASDSLGLSEDGDIYRNTFVFNTFVWMQVFNAVNARTIRARRSPFEGMTKSTSFLTIIGIIVVAQVVIVTWGGDVFSVEPQSLADWGKAIAIGASILIVGAMVRAIGRAVDPIAPAPAV
jgi:magnesium-transporting ATPase (P-type)